MRTVLFFFLVLSETAFSETAKQPAAKAGRAQAPSPTESGPRNTATVPADRSVADRILEARLTADRMQADPLQTNRESKSAPDLKTSRPEGEAAATETALSKGTASLPPPVTETETAAEAAPPPPSAKALEESPAEPAEASKKWKLNAGHSVNMGAAVGSRAVFVNSVRGQYKISEKQSIAAAAAHSAPLGFVADDSSYGLTDISLSASFPPPLPAGFLAEKWSGAAGVSLPTSHKSRVVGKWLSLFASANHVIHKGKANGFSGGHTFYAGVYKYRSGKSGYRHNPIANSFHSLSWSGKYKNFSFSAQGRLYLSLTLKKKSAGGFVKRLRLQQGGQGASVTLSYTHPKPEIGFFGQAGVNSPFISPVLQGFSFLRGMSYTFGVRWDV